MYLNEGLIDLRREMGYHDEKEEENAAKEEEGQMQIDSSSVPKEDVSDPYIVPD